MKKIFIRPLAKVAYAEEFEGDTERRTAAYSNVREDSSTVSTYKLPAEVEFCKRSISQKSKQWIWFIILYLVGLIFVLSLSCIIKVIFFIFV
ncbi:MAG: palindromic element RPE1 domain-containing protein [Rickettsia endosymbiont of Labidopullus appendiculatus]|nr:palindromic element RPE1 domain-containing protein [Rickettsia endosymbiont of Labidopullus appendiculatus]